MSDRDQTPKGFPFPVRPKMIMLAIVVLIIAGTVMSSFYVVDQTEQAVILFLGNFKTITGPGLQFKLPFGIERNYNVPTQVIQTEQFGFRTERAGVTSVYSKADFPEESIMLTGDLNIVDVEWTIQYRIVDPRAWLFNVQEPKRTIRDISQSIVNRLVGDRTIFDVIGSERTNIEIRAQETMNNILDSYGLGINITTVKLRNIVPPAGSVQDAFEDVNKAIQDMERLINEGREQYNKEIPKAKGQAQQLVQEAQGYAAEKVNRAQGDVARFTSVLQEYRRNPDVTRSRLYIEMIEDVFGNDPGSDLIDRNLENFLPLKNLQGQGGL
ncbi:FtsH protease activity modulator HflK [Marispirochaeta aestuarii]|uniref:FtsH protease activity modulator HflK n=1 Tax=Marispirochaeta aestuarii TaxID=1963862 RepID=UPI0029C845BB|nr:FtsH protease activity modulator HflK [Marispirochaeta aestuarii]